MSDCEEKIYSNDYVDFIISKDVLDVIDLSSDCIQRIDEERILILSEEFSGYLISGRFLCFCSKVLWTSG